MSNPLIQRSIIAKNTLRVVSLNPSDGSLHGFCRACGSPECVAILNVGHSPTAQQWTLELCADDFENLRQWLTAIKYRRAQEMPEIAMEG